MNLASLHKFRLKTKILNIVLGLPFICVILLGTISYLTMINLGTYAEEKIDKIGNEVSNSSKKSMENQAKIYLMWIISNQAAFSDEIFLKVVREVNRMTANADYIWSNPSDIPKKRSYSYKEKPKGIYLASSYKLAPNVPMNDVQHELNISNGLDQIFMSIVDNDDNLSFVYAGTESGILRIYPWKGDFHPSYDPRKSSWYRRVVKTGTLGWSELYVDAGGKELIITCSKPFYNSRKKLLGVIGADVMLTSITEKIINTQVGDLGYIFILDDKGDVIARPGLKPEDVRWDESFTMDNFLVSTNPGLKSIAEDMIEGKKGISLCHFGKVKKYIAYAPLSFVKWTVAVVMPIGEIISPTLTYSRGVASITKDINKEIKGYINKGQVSFFLVFLTMMIIIVFFGMRLSKKITEPILTLVQGAKIIGRGNLDYRLEIKTDDEIEGLAKALNKMAFDLKDHIAKLNKEVVGKERIEQTRIMITGIKDALSGKYSYEQLIPLMGKESMRKGEVLFKKGDQADKLYYIKEGSVRLVEIHKIMGKNNVIGEMGLFQTSKQRTSSAICESDVELHSITHDKLFNLFHFDPAIGFHLIQLVTRRLIENLKVETKEKELIESELRIAHDIQANALPSVFPPFPDRKEIDIFAYMEPAKEVGGDLYDFFFIGENKLCFMIGDVSGKGVPAALFMMITKALFKAEALRGVPLEKVLYNVNNIIASENDTSMFITLLCAIIDTETGELEYCNAGHNYPLVYRSGNDFEYIKPKANFVLGPMEEIKFPADHLVLKPDDMFFLYTDGVTEAQNSQDELYSDERLQKTLSNLKNRDLSGILDGVRDDVKEHVQDAPPSDDITMLVLKFNG